MFCRRSDRWRAQGRIGLPAGSARAFTLLEVVLAVAIIAMMTFSIYRFVEGSLRAIALSTEQSTDDVAMQALISVIQAQLQTLPPGRDSVLLGEPHKFKEKPSDEMQWVCGPGNGLFTQFAEGEYTVTFTVQPVRGSTESELGLRRVPAERKDTSQNWLPLLEKVDAMEIRYFDPRLNAWLERWSDLAARPSLVRIRIWRTGSENPHDAIVSLPPTGAGRGEAAP